MRVRLVVLALMILPLAANAQATLVGYVRDESTLRGLPGAELSVDGSDKRERTDKEGRYRLRDLPAGAVRVHVRLVGFAQIDTILELADGGTTENVFFLGKRAIALDTVVTNANRRTAAAGFESFETRRERGFGRFLDSVSLRERENQQLGDVVRAMGSVDIAKPGTCRGSYLLWCDWGVAISKRTGTTVCAAQVMLDGQVIARGQVIDNRDAPPFSPPAVLERFQQQKMAMWGKTFNLNSIGVSSLRGIELYRSAGDAQGVFGGDDAGCGVLVLWSRRG